LPNIADSDVYSFVNSWLAHDLTICSVSLQFLLPVHEQLALLEGRKVHINVVEVPGQLQNKQVPVPKNILNFTGRQE